MSSFFDLPPPPHTPLARYRILSPNAAVRVSPLTLGGGNIGDKWHSMGMGAMDKESSFKLLDKYFDMGGNFLDTANTYQDETSEMFIGEWAEKRGIRDQLIIATKFTGPYKRAAPLDVKINYSGNSIKNMNVSIDASLRKLRTHYIDILYIHWWDFTASVEEMMNGLHNLVVSGKVLYLGISDTPAWVVAYANQYAKDHGKTPFVIYQGAWNVMSRSFERDIIPMARTFGLALAPWDVIGGGRLRSDAEEQRRRETGENGRAITRSWERTEDEIKMSKALEKVALEVTGEGEEPPSIPAVAVAYILHKYPYVTPIVGGRKVEQLEANVKALEISLTDNQIAYLESIIPFDPGFPHKLIGDGTSASFLMRTGGYFEKPGFVKPIKAITQKELAEGFKSGGVEW